MAAPFTVEQVDRARVGRRRITFFTLVFLLTSLATWFMADLLWRDGMEAIEWVVLGLFVILFAHIAVGFSTALLGLYVLIEGLSFLPADTARTLAIVFFLFAAVDFYMPYSLKNKWLADNAAKQGQGNDPVRRS